VVSAGGFVRGSANPLVLPPGFWLSATCLGSSLPAVPTASPPVKLLVIGGGKMGEALVGGLLAAGWAGLGDMLVIEPAAARRTELDAGFPGLRVVEQLLASHRADGALVAVKPQHVIGVCTQLAPLVDRVLSIAAGVPIASIEAALRAGAPERALPVVRCMPNTPALVGLGASAVAAGSSATEDDLAWAESILGAVGIVERVEERLLDAVTGLSGSGPAYVFVVAEALIDAGVLLGLPRRVAAGLAAQTIQGAGALLSASPEDPARLRADVTSPGGTTAAGLRALESAGLRAAVIDAVVAAAGRSAELA
jgi:pyrroline-5-carboxylate reductase